MTNKTFAQLAIDALDRLDQSGRRPFTRGNLQDWLAIESPATAQRTIARLVGAGCIRVVGGGGRHPRMFERVPGTPAPLDLRGRSDAAQVALEKGRALRIRASRGFVLRFKR